MSDDDLIRRGDALAAVKAHDFRWEAADAIAALPARGVGVDAETVKNAVMGWVWAEDSDVSKRLGPKHTDALIARILAALAPTDAPHVNETPKSEHDADNVLTDAAQAREAALKEAAAVVQAEFQLSEQDVAEGTLWAVNVGDFVADRILALIGEDRA